MSKSKSKKKSNSRAKRKQTNVALNSKTNTAGSNKAGSKAINESKEDKQPSQTSIANQDQTDAKLTVYTASAMLTILISTAAMIVAMVMLAKPAYYVMEANYGSGNDTYTIDMLSQFIFEDEYNTKLVVLFVITSILICVSALLSFINLIRSMNPVKKPSLPLVVAAFVCATAAMVVFFINKTYAADMDTVDFMDKSPMFNIYGGLLIAVIANTAFMFINILGTAFGLSKWKKDGSAY